MRLRARILVRSTFDEFTQSYRKIVVLSIYTVYIVKIEKTFGMTLCLYHPLSFQSKIGGSRSAQFTNLNWTRGDVHSFSFTVPPGAGQI